MKLYEIQTITPKDLRYRKVHQPIEDIHAQWSRARRQPGHTHHGTGAYASVYSSEKDPGTVEKIASANRARQLSDDGYYLYLDMLSHNERMQNNPYFPKIYSLKSWKDPKTYKAIYSVKMEKLVPLSKLSLEQIEAIGERIFSNFDQIKKEIYEKAKKHGYKNPKSPGRALGSSDREYFEDYKIKDLALWYIAHYINSAINSGVTTYIIDPQLRQAVALIRGILVKREQRMDDLHQENIMARLGPGGAQLVITDPVV